MASRPQRFLQQQSQQGSQQSSAQPQEGSQQSSAQPQVGSQQQSQHFLAARRARSLANRPHRFLQQQSQQGSQQASAHPQLGSQQLSAQPQLGSQQSVAQPQLGSQPPSMPKNALAFEAPLNATTTANAVDSTN
ncbi:MAG: hypothetical protein MI725_02490 [Pirellulales bacterium]|nr:hypothetical protein [Pirellulales bacterium]